MSEHFLFEPLKGFYHRCMHTYRLGDQTLYKDVQFTGTRFCLNPHLSTECDIQIKLGGIIENYLLQNAPEYCVNAEMKIYGEQDTKNNRCDLTIHELPKGFLYMNLKDPQFSLHCAIEIKYINAAHPRYEFKRGLVKLDLDKLSTLKGRVLKYLVMLDEADNMHHEDCEWLISECAQRHIALFSNNSQINRHSGFRYGAPSIA